MKHQAPEIRFVSPQIMNKIGVAYLLIATALAPAAIGLLLMPFMGARAGAAIWFGIQLSALGTAAGVYLSDIRKALGVYAHQLKEQQRDSDTAEIIRRLHSDPVFEYFLLGWASLAARVFVTLSSAGMASLVGEMPFSTAIGVALIFQVSPYIPGFVAMFLLFLMVVKSLLSSAIGVATPMLLGVIPLPDLNGVAVPMLVLAGAVLIGAFAKVRTIRDKDDSRKIASGSNFYIAHEVTDGWLVDALKYGGGYERARDGVTLATAESQMHLETEGWKPATGDLHSGQMVATGELVALLREAANADSMRDNLSASNHSEQSHQAAA